MLRKVKFEHTSIFIPNYKNRGVRCMGRRGWTDFAKQAHMAYFLKKPSNECCFSFVCKLSFGRIIIIIMVMMMIPNQLLV